MVYSGSLSGWTHFTLVTKQITRALHQWQFGPDWPHQSDELLCTSTIKRYRTRVKATTVLHYRIMACLIQIGEKQWPVAGWVFDLVLRLARQRLPSAGSSRILELIDETATGLNHLSLDNLSRDELSIFYQALEQAYIQ